MQYEIEVVYNEDQLTAKLRCPLCKTDWEFPFPARRVFQKPFPSPEMMVTLHLYGAGLKPRRCPGFDSGRLIPLVEAIAETKVRVTFEPIR